EPEVDDLETVAMLVAEMLSGSGATDGGHEGVGATVPRLFAGTSLMGGIATGPVVLLRPTGPVIKLLADDPDAEQIRLNQAVDRMQRGLDDLFAGVPHDGRPADIKT